MNKFKLSKEEQAYENEIDQYVPVDDRTFKEMVAALETRRKDAVLCMRLNSHVLQAIKQKAHKLGIKYQSLISEVLYKMAQGELKHEKN